MGALDGFGLRGLPEKQVNSVYIDHQSAFHLYDKFTIKDLAKLVDKAERDLDDMVWVPDMYHSNSKIGISAWYARALLERL